MQNKVSPKEMPKFPTLFKQSSPNSLPFLQARLSPCSPLEEEKAQVPWNVACACVLRALRERGRERLPWPCAIVTTAPQLPRPPPCPIPRTRSACVGQAGASSPCWVIKGSGDEIGRPDKEERTCRSSSSGTSLFYSEGKN